MMRAIVFITSCIDGMLFLPGDSANRLKLRWVVVVKLRYCISEHDLS